MALVESMDTAMLSGDNNADDTTEDVTGLRTHASVTETTLTQTNSAKIAHVLGFLAGLVDGKHATSLADLGVVASVGSQHTCGGRPWRRPGITRIVSWPMLS